MTQASPQGPWIHRVRIENFRRFSKADWSLNRGINCLIGAGDTGKTTLMTAIEFALWPSYALTVTDNDFHHGNVNDDLVIDVWVVNPPAALRTDAKYLSYLQGFDGTELHDDPTDSEDDQAALQVELRVSRDLEPAWSVVKASLTPRPIRAADRSSVGTARIGEDLSRHLRWTRGSALMRLSPKMQDANDVVRAATRDARHGASPQLARALKDITDPITDASHQLRAMPTTVTLVGNSDLDSNTRGMGQVALHTDQDVPVGRSGQGTQRLVAIAAQLSTAASPGILLLDELEHGLEPHRVQQLISALKHHVTYGQLEQVVLTTHSPRAIRELAADELSRVRVDEGDIPDVRPFIPTLQGSIRWAPEALLCPKVIVCEGATEVGIIRGLVAALQARTPPRYAVVEAADARGEAAVVGRANDLHQMGYEVAAMYDLDKVPKDLDHLAPEVAQFSPEPGNATEHQLFTDLSDDGVRLAITLAQSMVGFDYADLDNKLLSRGCSANDRATLMDSGCLVTAQTRRAIADTAHKDGWFKRIDFGESLIQRCLQAVDSGTHLAMQISALSEWMLR